MEMTKRERIRATLAGKAVDRIPVAFWKQGDFSNKQSLWHDIKGAGNLCN